MEKSASALAAALLLLPLSAYAQGAGVIDQPTPLVNAHMENAARLGLMAGMGISVHDLSRFSPGRRVRVSGTVANVQGRKKFVLRDGTGSVDVNLASGLPVGLEEGIQVSVAGQVGEGWFGPHINAHSVTIFNDNRQTQRNTPPLRKGVHLAVLENTPAIGIR